MFQVWFDHNLNESIQRPASYDDYPDEVFPIEEENGIRTKVYRGAGSPLQMESSGVEIVEKFMGVGEFSLSLNAEKMHSIYLVNGQAEIDGEALVQDDFMIVKDQAQLELKVTEDAQFFIISSLEKLTYRTYAETYGR